MVEGGSSRSPTVHDHEGESAGVSRGISRPRAGASLFLWLWTQRGARRRVTRRRGYRTRSEDGVVSSANWLGIGSVSGCWCRRPPRPGSRRGVRRRAILGESDRGNGSSGFVTAAPLEVGWDIAGRNAGIGRSQGWVAPCEARAARGRFPGEQGQLGPRQGGWGGRKGAAGRAGPRRGPRPRRHGKEDQYNQLWLFWF